MHPNELGETDKILKNNRNLFSLIKNSFDKEKRYQKFEEILSDFKKIVPQNFNCVYNNESL